MRRYPTLTWEYGPKTREILAERELQAFLDTEIDAGEYEEVTLSLLDERKGDQIAAPHPRKGRQNQTPTRANQDEEAQKEDDQQR